MSLRAPSLPRFADHTEPSFVRWWLEDENGVLILCQAHNRFIQKLAEEAGLSFTPAGFKERRAGLFKAVLPHLETFAAALHVAAGKTDKLIVLDF